MKNHCVVSLSSLCHHYVITLSSFCHQHVISLSSVYHHSFISLASVCHQSVIIPSLTYHHSFISLASVYHHFAGWWHTQFVITMSSVCNCRRLLILSSNIPGITCAEYLDLPIFYIVSGMISTAIPLGYNNRSDSNKNM